MTVTLSPVVDSEDGLTCRPLLHIVVSVVDGHRDIKPSVGLVLDERWSRVRVSCGVVDEILVRSCYYDWGCG